jgi:Fe-S cluster assembly ATP-binding protein
MLSVKNLHVSVEGKEILRGVDLTVRPGGIHALMGPNGSGKSTLAYALMGHPRYEVTKGSARIGSKNILKLSPDLRAKTGLFLAFQYPMEIPGVTVLEALHAAINSRRKDPLSLPLFREMLAAKMAALKIEKSFMNRNLNEGFSGGEKKRAEILQLAVLEPTVAILDETDSGLDVDALREVAQNIRKLVGPKLGVLVITHYQRILRYLEPDFVHVMMDGKIVVSGGPELAQDLEKEGYKAYARA